jgi:energy-coupling factor transport system ATP-binding protein
MSAGPWSTGPGFGRPIPVSVVARDIAVTYPGWARPAVSGVSFDLAPGACLVVAGPSGSGKSTLARAIAGLVPWAAPGRLDGDLQLDGRPVARTDPAALLARIGIVFQDPSSQLVMERAEDDVAFGLEGRGWLPTAMRTRVPAALAEAGLGGFDRRRTARLSGGEQQRLALAGAFAPHPGLLVLDEPTANLDPPGALAFAERLALLRGTRATTLVLVEHRADLAWPLADLVLALAADGTPLAFGTPAELLARHRPALVSAGIWLPDEPVAPLLARGAGAPAPGYRLGVGEPRPSLPTAPPADLAPAAPAAEAHNVGFAFEREIPVLSGLDLAIEPGARVALLGPNGSGKSTAARLLVGLLRPTRGTVRLAGRDPARIAPRELARLAGYVTQDPERSFLAGTVEADLLLGLTPAEQARAGDVATALGLPLDRFGARNPFTLSGGEQRRLSLAAQLVRRPGLLVLDEPTFGQDRRGYEGLLALVRGRVEAGTAVVAATHDLRFAAALGGRVVRLAAGRSAEDAT